MQNAKRVFKSSLNQHRVMVEKENLCRVSAAAEMMDSNITAALKEENAKEELHLWEIHCDNINQVWKNGGKSRHNKAPVHPILLNWAISRDQNFHMPL